jgi:hypothetical protein
VAFFYFSSGYDLSNSYERYKETMAATMATLPPLTESALLLPSLDLRPVFT